MGNLVSEKRMDKNGVLVTRHVRSGSISTNASKIPAPSNGVTKKTKPTAEEAAFNRRLKALDRQHAMTFSRKKMMVYANWKLEKLYKNSYSFTCSDNDFYSVMEKLTFDDTVVLMAAGLRPHQLDEFITKQYPYDGVDNSELVASLKSRAIPLKSYLEVKDHHSVEHYGQKAVLDAAETHALLGPYIRENNGPDDNSYVMETYVRYVGAGIIKVDDMKAVGIKRCSDYMADFTSTLTQLNKRNSKCTAEELGAMIDRIEDSRRREKEANRQRLTSPQSSIVTEADDKIDTCVRARIAVRYGVEFTESIASTSMLFYGEEIAKSMPESEGKDFLLYADAASFGEQTIGYYDTDDNEDRVKQFHQLWKAGVSSKAAREGLESGLTAQQVIGVEQDGVASSVATGWL